MLSSLMIPDGRRPWRPFRTLLGTHCRRYLLYSACPSLPSDFIVLHAQATHSLRGEPGKKNMGFQRVHLVLRTLTKVGPLGVSTLRHSPISPIPPHSPFASHGQYGDGSFCMTPPACVWREGKLRAQAFLRRYGYAKWTRVVPGVPRQ